jgi:hypothetical protein
MARWTGASRRASANVYAKSASATASSALGSMKLRTPKAEAPKAPKQQGGAKPQKPPASNVSFGTTGYSKEDWYGPL